MPEWIAECGSNHNGELARALRLIEKAQEIGCTGVKFQEFRIEDLYAPEALAAKPELLERKAWELSPDWHNRLATAALELGLAYGVTVFGRPWTRPRPSALVADYLKISSYQLLDEEMLRAVASQGLPIVLSTGMATFLEVWRAIEVLDRAGVRNPTILHCVSSYPAPAHEANLRAMDVLRKEFPGCEVGWSDHTHSELVVQRAVHRFGAEMVEFHLDLDGDGWEYPGGHCWLPNEIQPLIQGPKAFDDDGYYACDGKAVKAPTLSETEERGWRSDPTDGLRPLSSTRAALLSVSRRA